MDAGLGRQAALDVAWRSAQLADAADGTPLAGVPWRSGAEEVAAPWSFGVMRWARAAAQRDRIASGLLTHGAIKEAWSAAR
jgi:hypothetical protein